jgi:sigma-B regulation protein RsbU (phosphoserine phosphatase)
MSIVEQKVRTLMAVPLQTEKRTIGLIYVDSPNMFRAFTKDDLSLLTVMANVAAIRIEHARLSEGRRDRAPHGPRLGAGRGDPRPCSAGWRTESGRRRSGRIQRPLPHGGVATTTTSSATQTGASRWCWATFPVRVCPASLMMMGLQARVQALLADEPQNLAAVINRLNKITCQNCPSNRFITFFYCVLDPATGELGYCNAGHNPPVIVRANGAVEYLEGGGPVLGILSIANYSAYRVKLEPGDTLAIYSDGVTEATNAKDEGSLATSRLQRCW